MLYLSRNTLYSTKWKKFRKKLCNFLILSAAVLPSHSGSTEDTILRNMLFSGILSSKYLAPSMNALFKMFLNLILSGLSVLVKQKYKCKRKMKKLVKLDNYFKINRNYMI